MNFPPSFYSWSRVKKYDRHLASAALFFGFIVDTITLARVDTLLANGILLFYLCLSAAGIFVANAGERGMFKRPFFARVVAAAPFFIQFCFGALFSGFLVLYGRSASLSATGIFVAILSVLFFGNEFLRKQYARAVFQVAVFYFALFSFLIFFIPIMLGKMGDEIFLISGAVSILGIYMFIALLWRVSPARTAERRRTLFFSVGAIFFSMNVFYFWNIIPPLPLSVKDAGIYYSVRKTDTGYTLRREKREGIHLPRLFEKVRTEGEDTLVAFSAVFAPARLSIPIVHQWQVYDEEKRKWINTDTVSFTIAGGREGGYRGYSMKSGIRTGRWRVNVQTPRGQLLGRIRFDAIPLSPRGYELEVK